MTNLDAHWDFVNHRPSTQQEKAKLYNLALNGNTQSQIVKPQQQEKRTGLFGFLSCLSVKSGQVKLKDDQKLKQAKLSIMKSRDGYSGEARVSVNSVESPFMEAGGSSPP